MKTKYLEIFLTIFLLFCQLIGKSQSGEIFNNCKVLSIDSTSLLPDYYIIKIMSEKGKIIILSKDENVLNNSNNLKRINIHRRYDFDLVEIDSITLFESDTTFTWYFKNQIRSRDDGLDLYIDGERFIEFEDNNFIPFTALNLNGLFYNNVEKD